MWAGCIQKPMPLKYCGVNLTGLARLAPKVCQLVGDKSGTPSAPVSCYRNIPHQPLHIFFSSHAFRPRESLST